MQNASNDNYILAYLLLSSNEIILLEGLPLRTEATARRLASTAPGRPACAQRRTPGWPACELTDHQGYRMNKCSERSLEVQFSALSKGHSDLRTD